MNNKNITKTAIFLIIVSLLLVSGIEGCAKEEGEKVIPGLSMAFVQDAPPATMTTEQKVPIYVDIQNNGGMNIGTGNAFFFLSGAEGNLDGIAKKLNNQRFLDRKVGKERLMFATVAKSGVQLNSPYMFPITVTACYDYETIAQIEACIAKENSNICSIAGEKVTDKSNSDSPLKVTSFTEKLEGNKLTLSFIIENKGVIEGKPGEVYLKSASCELINKKDVSETSKRGEIDVEVKFGKGYSGFKCDLQDGKTSFGATGKAKVDCVKTLSDENEVSATQIRVMYKYVDSIASTITLIPA